MNILFLCTYFPPDTSIAAKRPYYFAKYLTEFGHNITVIKSGKIAVNVDNNYYNDFCFEILSSRNIIEYSKIHKKNYLDKIKNKIKEILSNFYHKYLHFLVYNMWVKKGINEFKYLKKAIDSIRNKHFDIVFSTFGDIENAYGGEYARKIFNCKWIMDFRDPISEEGKYSKKIYDRKKYILEDVIVKNADYIISVSKGLNNQIGEHLNICKNVVLYNGYEQNIDVDLYEGIDCKKLNFCYTGSIFKNRFDAIRTIAKVIVFLRDNKLVDITNINFYYAGKDDFGLQDYFYKNNLQIVYKNLGYLNKKDVLSLQYSSDIFVSVNMNSKFYKGAISGKFYEGIQFHKPILFVVSGDEPYSEMYEMNEKYHFGYVYECCRKKEQFEEFCNYILDLYNQKIYNGKIEYNPNEKLFTDFRYDNLTKQLEKICFDLIKKK